MKFDASVQASVYGANIFEHYQKRAPQHGEYFFETMGLPEFALRFEPYYNFFFKSKTTVRKQLMNMELLIYKLENDSLR